MLNRRLASVIVAALVLLVVLPGCSSGNGEARLKTQSSRAPKHESDKIVAATRKGGGVWQAPVRGALFDASLPAVSVNRAQAELGRPFDMPSQGLVGSAKKVVLEKSTGGNSIGILFEPDIEYFVFHINPGDTTIQQKAAKSPPPGVTGGHRKLERINGVDFVTITRASQTVGEETRDVPASVTWIRGQNRYMLRSLLRDAPELLQIAASACN